MQQIWIPKIGGPEVLELREAPDPIPGPGKVRIQVEAAGVNFADLLARMGLYPDAPPLPVVVGYEVAGKIDAVGEGVSEERIGEDVVCMTRFGGKLSNDNNSSMRRALNWWNYHSKYSACWKQTSSSRQRSQQGLKRTR